ncbi:MAG: type I-E CRISPR-associated protein Cse1/CasA [Spirochaetia bacterium]
MENHFNLVEENWIPVADVGKVSLRRIFEDSTLTTLGGTPVQKISVMKLLLAIAQAAYTPKDDAEWEALGVEGLAAKCLAYLEDKKTCFWLYGERPFLQMPKTKAAATLSVGALIPDVAVGNTTVHFQTQKERVFDDSELALTLIQDTGFAFSGKKADNNVVLTPGYTGKTKPNGKKTSGVSGPSLGFKGLLHHFWAGSNIVSSIYLNLFTNKDINTMAIFSSGLGVPPWEEMPHGEDDEIARQLKNSYMGRLIPLSRFVYLNQGVFHYTEGIKHENYNDGIWDPSTAVNRTKSKVTTFWVDPSKKPWRNLTAILSFMGNDTSFECFQIQLPYRRVLKAMNEFGLWSGGISVSSNAGEQYCSGTDDVVESVVMLFSDVVRKEDWYPVLEKEMAGLDQLSKNLWGSLTGYFQEMKVEPNRYKKIIQKAQTEFWQLCENNFQDLVDLCSDETEIERFRKIFAGYVNQLYDKYCPKENARQMAAWAKCRPRLGKYLKNKKEDANDNNQ